MSTTRRHVLCAVDYSAASQTALRYAALAAERARAQLTVITVNDPLLVEAMRAYGDWPNLEREELGRFVAEALGSDRSFDLEVRAGRAADQILDAAAAMSVDLLVLGSHGLTGVRKMFFGSTAERVLRSSEVPVLVIPAEPPRVDGPLTLTSAVRRIVVPVDLSEGSATLVRLGAALAHELDVPLLIAHAIEPQHVPARWHGRVPSLQLDARDQAETALRQLADMAGGEVESLVLVGDAAETIVNIAEVRSAGLIVMGLQQSGLGRVGVIAYRVLCRARVPVLAIPLAIAAHLTPPASHVALTAQRIEQ